MGKSCGPVPRRVEAYGAEGNGPDRSAGRIARGGPARGPRDQMVSSTRQTGASVSGTVLPGTGLPSTVRPFFSPRRTRIS